MAAAVPVAAAAGLSVTAMARCLGRFSWRVALPWATASSEAAVLPAPQCGWRCEAGAARLVASRARSSAHRAHRKTAASIPLEGRRRSRARTLPPPWLSAGSSSRRRPRYLAAVALAAVPAVLAAGGDPPRRHLRRRLLAARAAARLRTPLPLPSSSPLHPRRGCSEAAGAGGSSEAAPGCNRQVGGSLEVAVPQAHPARGFSVAAALPAEADRRSSVATVALGLAAACLVVVNSNSNSSSSSSRRSSGVLGRDWVGLEGSIITALWVRL